MVVIAVHARPEQVVIHGRWSSTTVVVSGGRGASMSLVVSRKARWHV